MNSLSACKMLITITTILMASMSHADSKSQGSFRQMEDEEAYDYDRSVSSFGAHVETTTALPESNDEEPTGSMTTESSTVASDLDLEFEFEELTVNDVSQRNRMKFTDASDTQRNTNDGLGVSLKKSKKSKN